VGGPPPAPMDRSDARIQEALGRGRSLVAHGSRQYVASTWTNGIGRFRPFRPVRPGGTLLTPCYGRGSERSPLTSGATESQIDPIRVDWSWAAIWLPRSRVSAPTGPSTSS
jgi:hypothetical protein